MEIIAIMENVDCWSSVDGGGGGDGGTGDCGAEVVICSNSSVVIVFSSMQSLIN